VFSIAKIEKSGSENVPTVKKKKKKKKNKKHTIGCVITLCTRDIFFFRIIYQLNTGNTKIFGLVFLVFFFFCANSNSNLRPPNVDCFLVTFVDTMQVTHQQPISLFSVLLALLLLLVPGVEAWGAGDTVMLITGAISNLFCCLFC
jgi:hypothetical protein